MRPAEPLTLRGASWHPPCFLERPVGWRSRRWTPARTRRAQALGDLALPAAIGRLVIVTAGERVGQIILLHDGTLVVVGVEVAGAVAEALHERCRRVSEVERDGEDARAL